MPQIEGAAHAQDGVIPKFYMRPVLDDKKTEEAGYPVFKDVEWVDVIVLGSKNSKGSHRVAEKHRQKWPKQYEAFKKGVEYIEEGFRLEEWSECPRAVVETMRQMGVHTVEQFVKVGDDQLRYLGAIQLRDKAKRVLDNRDEKQEQINELKAQNDTLLKRLEALEKKGEPTADEKRKANLAKARAAKKKKAEAAKSAAAGG